MESYHIRGGIPIRGEYTVKGAKNAALPLMAASIMTGEETVFSGCPQISDVAVMKEILQSLGCRIQEAEDSLLVDTAGLSGYQVPDRLMEKMRSSIFLVGPLLTRCGKAVVSQPGGCAIGKRPIDLHIKALHQLGATIQEEDGHLIFTGERLQGAHIVFDFPSVGATENLMMAALGAKGETILHHAAKEPEIIDLQNYLNSCGAKIRGAGTSRICIKGQMPLHGTCHRIIGDRIEAGTYLMAAAATGGELVIRGMETEPLKCLIRYLRYAGCKVKRSPREVWLRAPSRLFSVGNLKTGPYPGFPTDLQPQFSAIMTAAMGSTRIQETVFENRFKSLRQIEKMGAHIEIFQRIAIIEGADFLKGTTVTAEDLRGGAALVLAGLMAQGETTIENVNFIERGYCNFHEELKKMGADIDRRL